MSDFKLPISDSQVAPNMLYFPYNPLTNNKNVWVHHCPFLTIRRNLYSSRCCSRHSGRLAATTPPIEFFVCLSVCLCVCESNCLSSCHLSEHLSTLLQDELYPHLSLYTLQPVDDVTKEMDHDAVIATDVIRLLVDSQVPSFGIVTL